MRFLAGCIKDDAETTLWNALKGIFGAFESLGRSRIRISWTDEQDICKESLSNAPVFFSAQ
jgi:hypothetical protein